MVITGQFLFSIEGMGTINWINQSGGGTMDRICFPLLLEPPMVKTLTFAAVHMSVAFTVGYAMTGSLAVGSALALVEPLVNTVAYYFHEKAWTAFA
jgi:uncharacterized membrane protein